jgi:hypothetical protein
MNVIKDDKEKKKHMIYLSILNNINYKIIFLFVLLNKNDKLRMDFGQFTM